MKTVIRVREIAHRGWAGQAPENTRAAFGSALEGPLACLADGMECDLQLSRDGRVVVMHDISLGRTSYGAGFVGEHTWKELSSFDIGSFFGPEFAGERIMLFRELLGMVDGRKFLCLELKNPGNIFPDMLDRVLEDLHGYPRSEFMAESFNHPMMKDLHERDASIQTGLIFHDEVNMLPQQCSFAGCRWASLAWTMADPGLLSSLMSRGVSVVYWTVNEEWQRRWVMERLSGCRGEVWVATDIPGMASGKSPVPQEF